MIKLENIKRVLVISLSNIGDITLTTPVVEALCGTFPGAGIDILISPHGKEIFEKHPKVSELILYIKKQNLADKLKLIKKLSSKKYDLVVDLKNTAIPYLIGAKYRLPLFRKKIKDAHKKNQHFSLLKYFGIEQKPYGMKIYFDDEDVGKASRAISSIKGDFCVFSCGAKSHVKRWAPENFALLADFIKSKLGIEVVLIGKDEGIHPDSDRVVSDKVKNASKVDLFDLVGKTNIRELTYIISRAKFIVTNDSAPLHIASAVNTPTIAVFGPTDEKKYGPLSEQHIILKKDMDCRPCEMAQCKFNYECMRQITIQDAIRAVNSILSRKF